ncbi:MAG: hypothetical protein HYR84_11900 [Planctomycetes bacterium]|nr:hypothetical protein [Planctomycetota bacterium]
MSITSTEPTPTHESRAIWWWVRLGIIASIGTIVTCAIWCYDFFVGQPRRDIPVFVHDGRGAPAKDCHLRAENGDVIELDDGGNAIVKKENAGKAISVRESKTGREVRVFLMPVVAPNGPVEIVVPSFGLK